jgi:Tfp pilus assembly protein PilF
MGASESKAGARLAGARFDLAVRGVALLTLAVSLAASTKDNLYELRGKVYFPSERVGRLAMVRLSGASTPYYKNAALFNKGSYHFKNLPAGPYILSAWVRGYGIYEQDVTIGPKLADKSGHIDLDLRLDQNKGRPVQPGTGAMISVRQLSIPQKARDEYAKAYQAFSKNNEAAGVEHLEKAVSIAPQYSEAWNTLGTVYHHRGDDATALQYFRESLKQNPQQFDALINLGIIVRQSNPPEALDYYQQAVKLRPEDPYALTQLGWGYFDAKRLNEAQDAFEHAIRVNANHISRPQLGLATVFRERSDFAREREVLEGYVKQHPDDPEATPARARIAQLARVLE